MPQKTLIISNTSQHQIRGHLIWQPPIMLDILNLVDYEGCTTKIYTSLNMLDSDTQEVVPQLIS